MPKNKEEIMEPVKFAGMNTNYVADGCGDLPAAVEKAPQAEEDAADEVKIE